MKEADSARLGRTDLVIAVLNTVVGAGIVALPGRAFAVTGERLCLALALAAALGLLIAMAFHRLARRYDGSGGPYRYVRETLGPRAALVLVAAMVPTRAFAGAASLRIVDEVWSVSIGRTDMATLALGAAMMALALLGVVVSLRTGNILGVLKLGLLVAVAIAGTGWAVTTPAIEQPVPRGVPDLGVGILLWFYALSGFESPTILAAECRNAKRDLPVALVTGLLGAVVLYALLAWVCLELTPDLATSPQPLLTAVAAHAPAAVPLLAIAFGLLVLPALPGQFANAPRLVAAVAEDTPALRLLRPGPDGASRLAIILFGALVLILTRFDLTTLIVASSAVRLVTYLICCCGLMRVGYREGDRADIATGTLGLLASIAALALATL